MRRFSERNSLVTLSDINITPLLDLAFVLLIIFVITTPLLEQSLNLKLPVGGVQDNRKIDPRNVRRVEVSPQGYYVLNRKPMTLEQISAVLTAEWRVNKQLIVEIRADENGPYKHVAGILNRLEKAGIDQVALRTEPPK